PSRVKRSRDQNRTRSNRRLPASSKSFLNCGVSAVLPDARSTYSCSIVHFERWQKSLSSCRWFSVSWLPLSFETRPYSATRMEMTVPESNDCEYKKVALDVLILSLTCRCQL